MADTSPSLTSSSHTLTALPNETMEAPCPRASEVATLLDSLRADKRHAFLRPSESLPTEALAVVRDTLEGFAAQVSDVQQQRVKESRKRKRVAGAQEVLKLRRVFVDGFETGQVWQQAKRIIGSVLDFSEGLLDELEDQLVVDGDEGRLVVANGSRAEDDDDEEEEEEVEEESEEGEEEDDDDDDDEKQKDEEDIVLEDGDDAEEGEEEEEEDLALEDELEDEGEDADEFIEDPNGLNDGFFSIDDFNRQTQWFEEQDSKGNPNTDIASDDEDVDWTTDPLTAPKSQSKRSRRGEMGEVHNNDDDDEGGPEEEEEEEEDDDDDGPTFGNMDLDAPEGDSEEEVEEQEDADDDADGFNANEVYYKDFFAPPPRKSKGNQRPKKAVRFEAPQPPAEEEVERAMADVRRDLFDDESEESGPEEEEGLSEATAGDPRSRRSAHERRQAQLAEEIRKLEAASVAKREWTLSGEAAATDRPLNSLLEEDMDFEHVGKPVPVITPEVTEGIEEMIKRRILAQQFDEVLRRRPGVDGDSRRRGLQQPLAEVDDSKASKSLAELYEEDHAKKTQGEGYVSASDEKLRREEREIEALWSNVSASLDALSSWHMKPKPAVPTLSVVADVAAVSMEDAQPSTGLAVGGAESSRLAPQEVYKAGAEATGGAEVVTAAGLPVARQEMTREEKLRRRRRAKERARKTAGDGAQKGGRAEMRRNTLADLKKAGVKVINRKGEITDMEGNKAKAAKLASSKSFKL